MDKVTIKQLPEPEQYKVLMDLISAATEDVKRWVTTNLYLAYNLVEDDDTIEFDKFLKKFHPDEDED
jgi:hypothetical protein